MSNIQALYEQLHSARKLISAEGVMSLNSGTSNMTSKDKEKITHLLADMQRIVRKVDPMEGPSEPDSAEIGADKLSSIDIEHTNTVNGIAAVPNTRRSQPVEDFLLLEIVDLLANKSGIVDYGLVEAALSHFDPQIKLSTTYTKVNRWKQDKDWITWRGRNRRTMRLTPEGDAQRLLLFKEALLEKERIENTVRTVLDESYDLLERNK